MNTTIGYGACFMPVPLAEDVTEVGGNMPCHEPEASQEHANQGECCVACLAMGVAFVAAEVSPQAVQSSLVFRLAAFDSAAVIPPFRPPILA